MDDVSSETCFGFIKKGTSKVLLLLFLDSYSQRLSDLVNIFCFENLVVKQHCTLNNFSSFVLIFICT